MQNQQETIKNRITKYTLIWMAFILELVLLFAIIFFYFAPSELLQSTDTFHIIILYLSYLFTIIAVPISYKIYDFKKNNCEKRLNLETKLEKYLFAIIIKFGILEFAAVFSIIAFLFNEIYAPLYMFGVILVAFLINKPSVNQFSNDFLKEDNIEKNVILNTKPNSENLSDTTDNSQ